MSYFVYILSNATHTTIYVGVTNDLARRLWEHKEHTDPNSFTAKYDVTRLVYFELSDDPYTAISREKQIKGWNRKRKNRLIEAMNPTWKDLSQTAFGTEGTDCHTSDRVTGSQ